MNPHRKAWLYAGPFGTLEIRVDIERPEAAARDQSARELRGLIYEFKYRDAAARRAVLEILAELRGLSRHSVMQNAAYDFDFGSPRAEALGEELLHAARTGRLVARPRGVSAPVFAVATGADEGTLGPEPSPQEDVTDWIGLQFVDTKGRPVARERWSVVDSGRSRTSGSLDADGKARVDGLAQGTCELAFPNVEASEWQPGVSPLS